VFDCGADCEAETNAHAENDDDHAASFAHALATRNASGSVIAVYVSEPGTYGFSLSTDRNPRGVTTMRGLWVRGRSPNLAFMAYPSEPTE
jgi:hypothetical protein